MTSLTSKHFVTTKSPLWLALRFESSQELTLLTQLADHLYQFTPHIEFHLSAVVEESGLLLEISTCLVLFDGVEKFCVQVFEFLTDLYPAVHERLEFCYGIGHSASSAWILSYQAFPISAADTQVVFIERLKQLPIDYLVDFPKQVDALHKMGFLTLGDLALQIEKTSLQSFQQRFSCDLVDKLRDIFSIDSQFNQVQLFQKPRTYYAPQEFFCDSVQLDYPIQVVDQLFPPIEFLLANLSGYLRKRQCETQVIEWVLADIYHHQQIIQVLSDKPQINGDLFFSLTRIQLENTTLNFAVDQIELRCNQAQSITQHSQGVLFPQAMQQVLQSDEFAVTTTKLKARLGEAALYKLTYMDSYVPEQSGKRIKVSQKSEQNLSAVNQVALRPKWLLKEPVPIEERNKHLYWQGSLKILAGPERIQTQWWDKAIARDYFMAERDDHQRLWIFCDLHTSEWFVQGVFS